jgi:uncharacterized protein YjdB
MKKISLFLSVALTLLFASCEKEENPGAAYIAESVTLDVTGMVIETGQVELLQATVLPDNLTDKTIVWRSSNSKIVTVNQDGEVTGVGVGQTMVTASALNGKKASCTITVTDVIATQITLNTPALSLLVGAKKIVQATVWPLDAVQQVTWSSNNTAVATVSETGEITAVAAGAATVTAATRNGLTADCVVTVTTVPATGITLTPPALNIAAGGGKEKLTATVTPYPGAVQEVTWSSSHPDIISVDAATGEVTAIATTGTAVITATVVENTSLTATCTVTIIPSITLTLAGYSSTAATLTYTDNTTEVLTLVDNKVVVIRSGKTIKSLTPEGSTPVLIGRKADSDVNLKFNSTALTFRDAVDGVIPIGSYAEFQLIRDALSGSYKQEADIDLMNELWNPIGETTHFSGTFDGADYALENIYVNSTSGEGKGLFGWATGATFKRIWVKSGSITSNQSCTGGLCGWSTDCNVFACRNNATINGGNNSTGGICGYGRNLFIACVNTGAVNTTGQYAGGIVAYCFDGAIPTGVIACYNTGTITGTGSNPHTMGGIAGQMNGSKGITASYSTGLVTSSAAGVGAIVGVNNATVTHCYWNTGNANAIGTNNGASTGNLKFSATAWPATSTHTEWGIGDGSGSGKYWKSLGSWNGGSPVYPKLFFEE